MGTVISYLKKPKKILILGPRPAGKTTVFEHIAASNRVKPKIDAKCQFNFLKTRSYNVWDLRCRLEYLSCYCDNVSHVIFMYDPENEDESSRIFRDENFTKDLRNAIILVCINKMNANYELRKIERRIDRILKRRVYKAVTLKTNGNCLEFKEGFEWMLRASDKKRI